MNKYLDLAEKVLTDSHSMLTARQIWESALRRGYVSEGDFGAYPWLALGRALSQEIGQHEHVSDFRCSRGRQVCYYLVSTFKEQPIIPTIDDLWTKIIDAADARENINPATLLRNIRSRDPRPQPQTVTVSVYNRDPDVIAFVRLRAKHHCEMCGVLSFEKDNGNLYVEVHHLMKLADGGSDIPENAVALCANCHRKLHYENDREVLLTKLVDELTAKGIKVKPQ